ncbi:MAG: c-type cytochrome [Verrucomicrobia bacterium]|nr:c-type cytochrome [Verrucomicrobiota bacterium]
MTFPHGLSISALFLGAIACFAAQPAGPAANDEVRKVMETFVGRGAMNDGSRARSPTEAMAALKLRDGLAIDLIASEPAVMQPLYLSFDSRGRLWVAQYIQYQFPAGLRVTAYDQHLRAQFDKVPEPPPRGVKGVDKITIFEDRDGDGVYETHRDVITGLNIASAAIKGAGGIWVMNPPYLLFYRDANDDDLPDGDPEVCLSGFGLEDTHSVASSLAFGPDGWLYGATGSTTTGNVSSAVTKNVRWSGQHIWRYHPQTKVFEIYAEGGGNTMSLEIDAQGRFFSGTNGTDRGMHYEQGMSGVKTFGKHGPSANPYAFGYFDHMVTQSDRKRFSQTLVVYDGDLMADRFAGKFVAPNSLQNMVYVSARVSDTSTFKAIDEAPLITSNDRWFRPVDIKVGPDGALWIADWYDARLSHVSPIDDWSKGDGRIYRVRPAGVAPKPAKFDLHRAPVSELLAYLGHANKWFRRQAALELAWRGERGALPELAKRARDTNNTHAFDALSALHMLGGLDDKLAAELLRHPDPYVRRWVVRCVGDAGAVSAPAAAALRALARDETQAEVRTQLLASAKRLPAAAGLAIARVMLERDADAADKRLPLLLWWVLEARAETDRSALLAFFAEKDVWSFALARSHGAKLLARRWAQAGGAENYEACTKLLALAPREADRALVVEGIAAAFEGGSVPPLPSALSGALDGYLKSKLDTDLALAVKTGSDDAIKQALVIVNDERALAEMRIALVRALAEAGNRDLVPAMLRAFGRAGAIGVKKAMLAVAAKFDDARLPKAVLDGYEARFAGDPGLRDAAHRMLASRREWAKLMLAVVDRHDIKPRDVADDVVRQLELYGDPAISALVRKHWRASTLRLSAPEKVAELKRIKSLLGPGGDVAKGKAHFAQRCAACHKLFDEGGAIGPELTGYERGNPDFWLVAILDPSAEIREGFGAYSVSLKNGQSLMGLLKRQDSNGIEIKDLAGQSHTAKTADIASLTAVPVSLMPEGLLGGMDDAALKDLFAYVMQPR